MRLDAMIKDIELRIQVDIDMAEQYGYPMYERYLRENVALRDFYIKLKEIYEKKDCIE